MQVKRTSSESSGADEVIALIRNELNQVKTTCAHDLLIWDRGRLSFFRASLHQFYKMVEGTTVCSLREYGQFFLVQSTRQFLRGMVRTLTYT